MNRTKHNFITLKKKENVHCDEEDAAYSGREFRVFNTLETQCIIYNKKLIMHSASNGYSPIVILLYLRLVLLFKHQ
jgi:hypothetical protein